MGQVPRRHGAQAVLDSEWVCDVCLGVFAGGTREGGEKSPPPLAHGNDT